MTVFRCIKYRFFWPSVYPSSPFERVTSTSNDECLLRPTAGSLSTSRSGCCKPVEAEIGLLHDNTATARLLWCIRILALGDRAPDRGNHVVPCAVAVGNDAVQSRQYVVSAAGDVDRTTSFLPLGGSAHGNSFPLKVLSQAVVEFC